MAARHAGWDVIYAGIRLAPDDIAVSAVEEDADLVGVSIVVLRKKIERDPAHPRIVVSVKGAGYAWGVDA